MAIIAAIPGVLASILSALNREKLGRVSGQIDGRLTELLDLTRKSSKAEGVKQELDRDKS